MSSAKSISFQLTNYRLSLFYKVFLPIYLYVYFSFFIFPVGVVFICFDMVKVLGTDLIVSSSPLILLSMSLFRLSPQSDYIQSTREADQLIDHCRSGSKFCIFPFLCQTSLHIELMADWRQ